MNDQQPQQIRVESNGIGLAGFIVSLVGLVVTCGLISPIGLVLSLIGLTKRPKGFAIAGTIIGFIGSLWFIFGVLIFGAGLLAMIGLGMIAAVAMAAANIGENAINVFHDIEMYYESNGAAPMSLTDIGTYTPAELEDNWGSPIRYQVSADGQEIWLRSNGEDMLPDTGDDFEFYKNFQNDDFHFKGPGVDIGG